MAPLSAVIITYNEEKHIEKCIRSVLPVADEVLVLDSQSTDQTREIADSLGARVIRQDFLGYREQKQRAVDLAAHDHVLSLDADEALSVTLMNSILEVKKQGFPRDAYAFNRLNNYCGQWIRYSNWYPDRKIRLFNRIKGRWGGVNPHDRVVMQAGSSLDRLRGDLLHWVHDTHEAHIQKTHRFSTIAADAYFRMGRKSRPWRILFSPLWCFLRAFVIKRGFLDGFNGFVISVLSAHTSLLKYIKLHLLWLDKRHGDKRHKPPKNKDIRVAGHK